ncbi:MAG: hypothetical protein ACUVQQ_00185 [Thermogutta sp.]
MSKFDRLDVRRQTVTEDIADRGPQLGGFHRERKTPKLVELSGHGCLEEADDISIGRKGYRRLQTPERVIVWHDVRSLNDIDILVAQRFLVPQWRP